MAEPKQYPVVDSSDQTSMAEVSHCPETWADNIMGFDKCGRRTSQPDDHNPKPEMPNPYGNINENSKNDKY